MADKIDIVIQKNISSSCLGDGQSKSTAAEQGGIGSRQHLRSSGDTSLDTEWSDYELEPEDTENNIQMQEPKIPKVPRMFREANKEQYDPKVVSIGPYHRNNKQLEGMEKLKVTMMKDLVKESKKSRKDFYKSLVKVVKNLKEYYDKDSTKDLDDKNFTDIFFLDGCFILQLIICFVHKPENLNMIRQDVALVLRDLFLLENQIPFEVLRSLLNVRFEKEEERIKLINDFIGMFRTPLPQRHTCRKKIKNFLDTYFWRKEQQREQNIQSKDYQEAVHLLELLRLQIIGEELKTEPRRPSVNYWHRCRPASELKRVGITFEPSENKLAWDVIKFEQTCLGGVLKLPTVMVDDTTKSTLLNMVAYESYLAEPYNQRITSYVCFMDSLIDNAEDVKELRSKGIILSFLGSDREVAQVFNEMGSNLVPNTYAYATVRDGIESYYKNTWKKLLVGCWLYYFDSPWYVIAYVGGIFVIILTAIQTYLTAFPVKGD